MIELLLFIFLVASGCACAGFLFGVVFAGSRAFESGRQQGFREARRDMPKPFRIVS